MRQIGVFGAKQWEGTIKELGDFAIQTIDDRPHGAVIAFDNKAFESVGYFDEAFGLYGMEHVDWSNRVSLSKIQPAGFHDVVGSEQFFKIHAEKSSITADRVKTWKDATERYKKLKNDKSRIYIKAGPKTVVPEVTYIVPFRGEDRKKPIKTVISNIKAQIFPRIEIIIVEHAVKHEVKINCFGSIRHILANEKTPGPFTKSVAMNKGAANASCDAIILHDADMIVSSDYTRKIMNKLRSHNSCHIGGHVIYMDEDSTNRIVKDCKVSRNMTAKMSVSYFEGGSLACTKKDFFKIGGFYEEFRGYGCEDCEFFERLVEFTNIFNMRTEAFLHLDHSRTSGWQKWHVKNKRIHLRLKSKSWDQRRMILIDNLKKNGYKNVLESFGINVY